MADRMLTSRGEPAADRARQFMPFAALKGYYDLLLQRRRVTEPRHELNEEEAAALDAVIWKVRRATMVEVTHYVTDAYETTTGMVSSIDVAARDLVVIKRHIGFDDILAIRILE